MPDFKTLLVICILVFLAGLVDSVAGGGGLISLPAYMIGLPTHIALGTNKFSSTFGTAISCIRFIKGKKANIKTALVSIFFALFGSMAGARVVLYVDQNILRYMLLFVIPIIAFFILTKKDFGTISEFNTISKRKVFIYSAITGLVLGFYDGFFGPGTGTFLILIYTGLLKFDLVTASGNAKLINMASNVGSLFTFLISGQVNFYFAIPAAFCSIAGNFVGSGLALKNGTKIIRPMFIFVLSILLLYIVKDLFSLNLGWHTCFNVL